MQAMLEILNERCRDVSTYTRSRVVQVWAELCEEHAVSIGLWNEIASVASGRLEDNPFGPQLCVAAFEATLEKYKEKLCQMEPSATSEDGTDADAFHGQVPTEVHEESASDSCLPHGDEQREEEAIVPEMGNLEQIRALVASLEAGLRFAKCITSTMATLVQLLASSSITDVEHTILLLMRCKQFQIDGSEACLRKMLPLVFSQDKSIYEAVENAFITIYIRKDPEETAKNLLNLALDSSIGDLAALECLVGSLVSKGEISSSTMSALWNFFSFNSNGVIAAQSRGALSILCMALKSTPGILGSHLQDIVDIGFGRWAKEEPLLARTACVALDRLSDEDKQKLRCGSIKIFGVLQSLLIGSWLPENVWYAAADKAIKAIYSIHPTPEIFTAEVVKKSISSLLSHGGNDEMPTDADNEDVNVSTVSAAKLGRCLFIISQVAFNQLVYIESCIHKLQKQKAKKEKSMLESEAATGHSAEASEKQNINAELGLGASEDAAIDALSERAEKEIVSGGSNEKNLVGHCANFVSKLCRNFNLLQKFPDLQASAMLALCRLMIIDADFCEANLQLLFTVVENAPSETVRSNCTLALGDLAVRFPNLLEPWTENIYARLRDPSVSVRKNAVLVLSHLILNDMMKVKGYINEMAMRIEDEEERISSLARLFFHELSKKGSNPIYNLLPDILGRLSEQKNMKKDSFHNIMQFLINSIKKDKQMEALVEKLCNRFSGVSDKTQWECIAYCLSQLTFTEKGMKKLMESFKTYEHVLLEDSVVDYFKNIISKTKKFAKPELKSCIDEFEAKLNKSHMERKEQEEIANNAHKHQQKIENLEHKDINERSVEDGTGVVINPPEEATSDATKAIQPDADGMNSEESCSILTECDDEDEEFQSRKASHGISKVKPKRVKSMIKGETAHCSMRSSIRTNRR